MCWQNRLFPRECCLVGLGNFGGRSLAAVTDCAAPVAHVVRNERMSAERLRDGGICEARLRYALVARRAAVGDIHVRQPDLIDVRTVIRKEFLCVWAALREFHKRTFVMFPFRAEVLERRNGQDKNTDHGRDGKREPDFVGQLPHLFSRHVSPKATPRTSPGRGKTFRPPSGKPPWR